MTVAAGSSRRRVASAAALVLVALSASACRPPLASRPGQPTSHEAAVARGAALYAGYCAGCHGADGSGDGPVAAVLNIEPTDLRAPGLLSGNTTDALVQRLLSGEPLRTSEMPRDLTEERQVTALDHWVRHLRDHDWDAVRAGRLLYERACVACHGVYGDGVGVLIPARPPADVRAAQARLTDGALAAIVRKGSGEMPPTPLGAHEMPPLIAYLRVLSPAYQLYGTYCAACHGDDGRGVHPEDRLAPATAAPRIDTARFARLAPAARRRRLLHMFRREQGLMPHFQGLLGADEIRDIITYLRS
jgi:mono/diheme cytochrome c family protein